MTTARQLLLDHLTFTFEKEGWQPPLAEAVHGLTAQQAAWKPGRKRHSIWQIVRHLLHWKRAVLSAWDGDPADFTALDDGDWPEVRGDQDAWERDVRALHDLHAEFRRRLEGLEEGELDRSLPWYRGAPSRPVAPRLLHMLTHDIYHAGQIQYVRALQGIPADRFFTAAFAGDLAALRDILDGHPDLLTAYNWSGWTGLQVAADAGRIDAVRFLLDRGAPVDAVSKNEHASTALRTAEKAGHTEVAELLRSGGARS